MTAAVVGAIMAILGVIIAYLAWIQPHNPDPKPTTPAAVSGPNTPPGTGRLPASATAGSPTATAGGPAGRYLTEIPPVTGAANVERPAGSTGVLQIHCASGQSDDLRRSVQYDLLGGYTTLTAEASISGPIRPESRAQVEVLADNHLADNRVFGPGQPAQLSAPLTGAGQLTLRVTCQDPAGVVRIADATLRPAG